MPQGYDGIALRENTGEENAGEIDVPVFKDSIKHETKNSGSFLEGILGNLHIGLPSLDRFGYEEILIIAVAAFLFFSDSGDRECAILLILLLLIN